MAYAGYLLKVNGKVFPNKWIKMDGYDPTPHQESDLDSYTDGDGWLVRNVLPHTRTKIEFSTVDKLTLDEKVQIQTIIPTSKAARIKFTAEYWDDDTNTYQKGDFYAPPITYPIHDADETTIVYNSIRIAFIEY